LSAIQVVEVKNKKAKITSLGNWLEYLRRRREEPASAARGESGACEEACEGAGGVETCGMTYVECGNGEVYLLDP